MQRVRIPEVMDDPALDAGEHVRALGALNRVNRFFGVDRQLYRCVRSVAGDDAASILDLGAGGGGFLAYVASREGERMGDQLRLALDRSSFALGHAARWHDGALRCLAADALTLPLADNSVDVVTSSLFLHHFDPPDVVAILRGAARVARKGIVMGDLTRSRSSLAVTWAAARVLSGSRVFRVDGPRSVRAAFGPAELAQLASQAGLRGMYIARRFPFRMVMMWRKVQPRLEEERERSTAEDAEKISPLRTRRNAEVF